MRELISKDEAILLFKVSKSLFEEMIKRYNVERVCVRKKVFYEKDTIEIIAKELEYRRNVRVEEW